MAELGLKSSKKVDDMQVLENQRLMAKPAGPDFPNPLVISNLENFYPPIAFRLGDDSVPPVLPLLISKGAGGVFIYEFIHLNIGNQVRQGYGQQT